MQLSNMWSQSVRRRGLGRTFLRIPRAASRLAMLAVRTRYTRYKLLEWITKAPRPAKVHIACGRDKKQGWLNTDLNDRDWCIDASRPLPFPDHSIDYLYSQHFVEHLTRHQACLFFAECKRVLRTDGTLRISTPDLSPFVNHYCHPLDETSRPFFEYMTRVELGEEKITAGQYINAAMRLHEHLHIFDFDDLAAALQSAGFCNVQRVPYGESSDPELRHLDNHFIAPEKSWLQPCELDVEARQTVSENPHASGAIQA